jgi:CRISPR type III-A-associated RAMP protein Csm4
MNPGLVVKLRPSGPWRIGPDSGARNRVDVIYHSDSLYSAVAGAMARMGSLTEWLDATARSQTPAVCFSSCFPFVEDIGFVVPPRTIWPPTSPAAMSARVRWKSARFVPLNVVETMLSGKRLNENHWSVDGASGCLLPAGKPGPFRTSVRWNAAVDRLSGASERHGTACIEFREGCGLWTVVSFADEAARDRWQEPVKAAFRLLADSGFGGERSRGWGRSETPEFMEGMLPGMVIEYRDREPAPPVEEPPAEEPPIEEPPPTEEPVPDPNPPMEADSAAPEEAAAAQVEDAPVTAALEPDAEPVLDEPLPDERGSDESAPEIEQAAVRAPELTEAMRVEPAANVEPVVEPLAAEPLPDGRGSDESAPEIEEAAVRAPELTEPMRVEPAADVEPVVEPLAAEPLPDGRGSDQTELAAEAEATPSVPSPTARLQAHWLLSLFTPAAEDTVDWGRGNYSVMARGGRIDSPAGTGELKKQIQMVAEGSVLYANGAPLGAAADVAPDGFAHPVFRAGFALAIPLPEVH